MLHLTKYTPHVSGKALTTLLPYPDLQKLPPLSKKGRKPLVNDLCSCLLLRIAFPFHNVMYVEESLSNWMLCPDCH